MGAGTFSRVKTWIAAEVLTASDLNAEFDNILNNLDPTGIDDESDDAAAMQATADPYPGSVASLATDLTGELHRVRYVLDQLLETSYWYVYPDPTIVTASTAVTAHTASVNEREIYVSASHAAITVTLPALATAGTGKHYTIKKIDDVGNAVTIDGNGSETIDGSATYALSNQWDAVTITASTAGANWYIISEPDTDTTNVQPAGWINGLHLSNHTDADHDIAIAVGECRSADDGVDIAVTATLVKQADASWATGDSAGGMGDGLSLATGTTYHVFLIYKNSDGSVDAGFDTDTSAANLLTSSSYDRYRRIGSVVTDGSSNILGFTQDKNWFRYCGDEPPDDVNVANQGATRVSYAISSPTGYKRVVDLNVRIKVGDTSLDNVAVCITDPDAADATPSVGSGVCTMALKNDNTDTAHTLTGKVQVFTNTSNQVGARMNDANMELDIRCCGWFDPLDD